MPHINVRTEVSTAVALAAASPRAGRFLVPLPAEEELKALSACELKELKRFSTLESVVDRAWAGYNPETLELKSPASWGAVVDALRATLAAEDAKAAAAKAKHESAVAAVLAIDPTSADAPNAAAVPLAAALGTYPGEVRAIILGDTVGVQNDPMRNADPRVAAWVLAARPNAVTARFAVIDRAVARVRESLASWLAPAPYQQVLPPAECDGWFSGIEWRHVKDHVGPWYAEAVAEKAAEDAKAAENAKAKREREIAAMVTWAAARDLAVCEGVAQGYSQRKRAREIAEAFIVGGLGAETMACDSGEGDLTERSNVSAEALSMAKRVVADAQKVHAELPEGVSVVVGKLSRQSYEFHAEDCDPDGNCADGCGTRKRTVVPVRVRGLGGDDLLVVVPVE